MTGTAFLAATEAARAVRRGEVSARELTEAVLARVDAVNPAVNAVVELRRDEALRRADEADTAVRHGVDLGPLHGVPITFKDCLDVTGLHTTWGNPAFRDFVASSDATVVRRLVDAGGVVMGKTNATFMLADFGQTSNKLFGTTNNPWDPELVAGGSSGGAAVAVATGMTFLDHGTDLVGSVRLPAAYCGVYGLRPTAGVVPQTGFQVPGTPATPSEMRYLSTVGPIARSAADLRMALAVTAGPDDAAASAYTWRQAASRHARLAEFRVGVVLDDAQAPVTSEVGTVLSDAVDGLAKEGATVVEGWPADVDAREAAEAFGFHVGLFFAFAEPGAADFAPLAQVVEQEDRRMRIRAAWDAYFREVDVLLCPASFTTAFPHDPRPFDERTIPTPDGERPYGDQAFWVAHAALPGLPAVSAPAGRSPGGLPVGAQILGPRYEDDTAVTFAELLADVVGGYEPPQT